MKKQKKKLVDLKVLSFQTTHNLQGGVESWMGTHGNCSTTVDIAYCW